MRPVVLAWVRPPSPIGDLLPLTCGCCGVLTYLPDAAWLLDTSWPHRRVVAASGAQGARVDLSLGQVSSRKVRMIEGRVRKVCAGQLRAAQLNSPQIRKRQVRIGQIAAGKIRTPQVRPPQVRPAKIASPEICRPRRHVPQVQSSEVDARSAVFYCCTYPIWKIGRLNGHNLTVYIRCRPKSDVSKHPINMGQYGFISQFKTR